MFNTAVRTIAILAVKCWFIGNKIVFSCIKIWLWVNLCLVDTTYFLTIAKGGSGRSLPGEARRGRRALLSDGGAPLIPWGPLGPGWKGGAACSKGPRELDGPLWGMWGPRMFGPPSDEVGGRCSDSSGGGLVLGQEPSKGSRQQQKQQQQQRINLWYCRLVSISFLQY